MRKNNQVIRENSPRDKKGACLARSGEKRMLGKVQKRISGGKAERQVRPGRRAARGWEQERGRKWWDRDQNRAERALQVRASMWILLWIKQNTPRGFRAAQTALFRLWSSHGSGCWWSRDWSGWGWRWRCQLEGHCSRVRRDRRLEREDAVEIEKNQTHPNLTPDHWLFGLENQLYW